jgi:hypothetical protein
MKYLEGSFAYLHRAAAAINEQNREGIVKFDRTRPGLVVDALLHSFNHLRPNRGVLTYDWHCATCEPLNELQKTGAT